MSIYVARNVNKLFYIYCSIIIWMFAFIPLLNATFLTDAELYFDPDSITPDYYTRVFLPDLTSSNNYIFSGGTDPIIDADILPILKSGNYQTGYLFSQSDYLHIPNSDYFGDLDSGSLTTTFQQAGLYHVRVTRQSSAEEIFAIFAETSLEEKDGAPNKTGANKKIDIPDADLYIVDNGNPDEANERETILENDGQTVEKVDSRQEAIDAIEKKSQQLGRKIHVEFAGHGTNGNASTGAGKENIVDKQIDSSSVADFQKEIDDYVNNITFYLMCSVGAGNEGEAFLKVLADSIGTAGGWDSPVYRVNSSHYTVQRGATFKVVPEPESGILLAIGLTVFFYFNRRIHLL